MSIYRVSISVLCLLSLTSYKIGQAQTNKNWVDNKTGKITIYPKNQSLQNGKKVEVIFYSDAIVRVVNLPEGNGSIGDTSLIVNHSPQDFTNYSLVEQGDSLMVASKKLRFAISTWNAGITYYKKNGETYIKEKITSPLFQQTMVNGQSVYSLNKAFQTSQEDNYYGLGQHQDDQYNYHDKQVSFFQNNTSVAIPFLISDKGYAILWDNYSLSKIGDVRSWLPISELSLYSEDGQKGWLTQRFYNDKANLENILTTTACSNIDMPYLGDSKKQLPADFHPERGLVTYKGKIAGKESGTYKFHITYAGYVTVKIDGKIVLDRWRQPWNPGEGVVALDLQKDQQYAVEINWQPDGTESYLTYNFLPPIPADLQNTLTFASSAGLHSDYYFIAGEKMDSLISGYRQLTGKAQMFPKWAFGFWQSRERYKTQAELLDVVKTFREKHIPLDNIVQDWSYWKENQWGSQNFDSTRFPDPSGMLKTLHEQYKTQFMISVWPKFYKGVDTYDTFQKKGWLYGRNMADSQRDWIGQGYISTFYDAFNKDARTGFWDLLNNRLYKLGVDAWWMDASEPDILSNVSPQKRLEQMAPTALGAPALWLNAYPLENARGIYEGQRSVSNNRVFLLTRSGFAGSQRYSAAIWSGDIASRWYDMKAQIAAGINFSLSGLPYWTMDIGGFSVERRFEHPNTQDLEEWRELQTRWYQFGTFVPLYRAHGQFPYREIYNIAPENSPTYKSILGYTQLRYKLMPYIYSLVGATYWKDYTIMRSLCMDFASDKKVANIGDQFMFGDALLINPVYTYQARQRQVYLPNGTDWYNFNTGQFVNGGKMMDVEAPYETMPMFVKAGSIIPTGPDMEYVAQKKVDPLTIYVFEGEDGDFELYEDNGLDYSYEKGKYHTISLHYNDNNHQLTIDNQKGYFPEELQSRKIQIAFVKKTNNIPVFKNAPTKIILYKGQKQIIQL